MTLRVLHVIASLRGGGAESMVRALLPPIASRGVDLALFSAYEPGLSAQERATLPYDLIEGRKRGRFDYAFGARVVGAMRRFRPDVVHTHTVTGKYWGRASAIAAGVPHIVHTEHSSHFAPWEPPFAHLLARRTDAVISFSQRTAALVASREPVARMEIIPNGIEPTPAPTLSDRVRARASLSAPDGLVVFGLVASLIPLKNHALAIAAFARLPSPIRAKARLDFFGRGPQEQTLRALAHATGVADRVMFWGFRDDVRSLLPGLDVLLTVSSTEAAPISMLEGMSAALPIIGTPHHGTLDLVVDRQSGIIVSTWSELAVATALQQAIVDSAWRGRAGAAGRLRIERDFNIATIADRHIELYRNLVHGKAHAIVSV